MSEKNPIRILQVVVNMQRAGAETLLMNLYRNIDRNKVQLDFLTFREGVFDDEIRSMGGNIYRIPWISDTNFNNFIYCLNKFFKEYPYEIVHSHLDKMNGIILKSAKKHSIPIRIAHSHNIQSEGGIIKKLIKYYYGLYIPFMCTDMFACSYDAADWLFGRKSKYCTIMKNGIEIEKFKFNKEVRARIRQEFNITKDTFLIGHVGRFTKQKNHDFLIDIFKHFQNMHPHSKLFLVGEGPLQNRLMTKVSSSDISEHVIFVGVRDDICDIMQAFDIFVFPSIFEGFGIVLLEAQAAGLFCVTSDNVPSMSCMDPMFFEQLPLKDPAVWALAIDKASRYPRMDMTLKVSQNGYDIKAIAKDLERYYICKHRQVRMSRI